jgi:hypothetical protein
MMSAERLEFIAVELDRMSTDLQRLYELLWKMRDEVLQHSATQVPPSPSEVNDE